MADRIPKVSVIMPMRDAAQYVGQAIHSLLRQTLPDWELIVVDDGSTDDSLACVQAVADPRIRVFWQANQGAGSARNTALDLAQGEYVTFLDADDVLFSRALEWNAQQLDDSPAFGVIYSDGYFCDRHGRLLRPLSAYRPCQPVGDVLNTIIVNSFIGPPCCAMVRRSGIENRGLRFDADTPIGEDWEFFIRLAETEQFAFNHRATCMYRVHPGNSTLTRVTTRRACLRRIRRTLLQSSTFFRLTPSTRHTFFYQLCFETLHDSPMALMEAVSSPQFGTLPCAAQATLLRLLAVHWLLQGWPAENALQYLHQSSLRNPAHPATRLLRVTASLSPGGTAAFVNAWRWLSSLQRPARRASPPLARVGPAR